MRVAPFLLALLATGLATPATARDFDVFAFFSGQTEGVGRFRKIMSRTEPVLVHGTGHVEGDTLVVAQDVAEAAKPVKHREWHMMRSGAHSYVGTLTSARGAISGEVEGDTLRLAFALKGGYRVRQRLTLAPDGRSTHNLLVVRKAGIVVARLDETIRKTCD